MRVYIFEKTCIKNNKDKLKFYDQYHAINEIVSRQKKQNSRILSVA